MLEWVTSNQAKSTCYVRGWEETLAAALRWLDATAPPQGVAASILSLRFGRTRGGRGKSWVHGYGVNRSKEWRQIYVIRGGWRGGGCSGCWTERWGEINWDQRVRFRGTAQNMYGEGINEQMRCSEALLSYRGGSKICSPHHSTIELPTPPWRIQILEADKCELMRCHEFRHDIFDFCS